MVLIAVATLLASSASQAAMIDGAFNILPFNGGSYTGPSLQDATSMTFAPTVYASAGARDLSSITFPDTVTFATLPTFAATGSLVTEPDVVPSLIELPTNGAPSNRFQFDLSSLGEIYSGGGLVLYGTGTLRDTSAVYSPTPAEFTGNGFVDNGNGTFASGSFSFAAIPAVPEPASVGLLATGAAALLMRRRRA